MKQKLFILSLLIISNTVFAATEMAAGRISDIRNTKHNFAASDPDNLPDGSIRSISASTENQVCVFCHTPHGKYEDKFGERPFLWNRPEAGSPSARYDATISSSFNATNNVNLGQGSKMCLSCHDGTVAIGNIDTNTEISVVGDNLTGGKLSQGGSYIGQDLSDDHPVGFDYNAGLSADDGELYDPAVTSHIGVPVGRGLAQYNSLVDSLDVNTSPSGDQVTTTTTDSGGGISIPLEATIAGFSTAYTKDDDDRSSPSSLVYIDQASNGSVECTTCHDPHIRGNENNTLNGQSVNIKFLRLNRFQKAAGTDGSFSIDSDINCIACHDKAGWAGSIHVNSTSGVQQYDDTAADNRDFPHNIQMWQASCLNCHKPHTSGAGWLLASEDDGTGTSSATEQTCLSCHGSSSTILAAGEQVANIEKVMLSGNAHGDSGNNDQSKHSIHSGNFDETGDELNGVNRHVTCTDCHNPHRMIKNSDYDAIATGVDTQSTHLHGGDNEHSNKASGALRGVMGVEPDYTSVGDTFAPFDTSLQYSGAPSTTGETDNVLVGDPSEETDDTKLVSKEYQVCLKCHSAYGSTIASPNTKDLALEFQPANDDRGANHNSWHPVIGATGRSGISVVNSDNFVDAFDQGIGTQTMYCSDCHNNSIANLSDPTDTEAKGPHGSSAISTNSVMLIAPWDKDTGAATPTDLCFQCHKYSAYADITATPSAANKSNFSGPGFDNLHLTHAVKATNTGGADVYTCSLCHVSSAHGWKNKALLIDKNVPDAALDAVYYTDKAKLQIDTYQAPGAWVKADCASSGCHI